MNIQSHLADVGAYFETHHHTWDEIYRDETAEGRVFRTRLSLAMALCRRHMNRSGRVLDLGCGCGPASLELAKMGHHVTGIDLSQSMIDRAEAGAEQEGLADRCRFLCSDFASFDPSAAPFDIVVALGFIEYFDDPQSVLTRVRDLLCDDGVAVIQITNRMCLQYLLQGRIGRRVEQSGAGLDFRQYTPGEFARLARQVGLKRIDYRGHRFGPLRIGHRFIPGYRAAHWLERRLDDLAGVSLCRSLGRLGTSFLNVLCKVPTY